MLSRYLLREQASRRHIRSRAEYADDLGISVGTLNNLIGVRRKTYSEDTKAAVELGLSWAPGSFDTVVAGGEPTIELDADTNRLMSLWARCDAQTRRIALTVVAAIVMELSQSDVPVRDNPATASDIKPPNG